VSGRCAVRLAHAAALLGVSLSASSATAPSAGDLARCAGMAAPDARLACYDLLAGRSADRAVPATAAAPAPTAAATTATVRAAAPASAPAPASSSTAASDPRNFGLTQAQLHAAPEGPAAIQARVAKIIDNRSGLVHVVLDNGQTWMLTEADEDARLGLGDPVTIKRASLGSFLMVTQSKRSYHVRRTQ
jgi:hypothetical protein